MSVVLAICAVLAIIYVIPFVVYATASALHLVDIPAEASPRQFLLGVLVTKAGTAAAFVLLAQMSGAVAAAWPAYALIWFVMFAASEVGEAISGRSTWPEAGLGMLAEAVYAPAAALAAFAILGIG